MHTREKIKISGSAELYQHKVSYLLVSVLLHIPMRSFLPWRQLELSSVHVGNLCFVRSWMRILMSLALSLSMLMSMVRTKVPIRSWIPLTSSPSVCPTPVFSLLNCPFQPGLVHWDVPSGNGLHHRWNISCICCKTRASSPDDALAWRDNFRHEPMNEIFFFETFPVGLGWRVGEAESGSNFVYYDRQQWCV